MVLPSAPSRRKSHSGLHRETCITSHKSLSMTSYRKLPIISPTWEAPSPEKPTSTWKSITDSQNQLCIWKTQEESMGPTRNQPRHQAKGIHGCGANCPAIYVYACESWTVYSRHARKLNHFHIKCLRIIVSGKIWSLIQFNFNASNPKYYLEVKLHSTTLQP